MKIMTNNGQKQKSTKGYGKKSCSVFSVCAKSDKHIFSLALPPHCHLHRLRGGTRRIVFITPLPSLGITQISLDILADESGNKGSGLLAC